MKKLIELILKLLLRSKRVPKRPPPTKPPTKPGSKECCKDPAPKKPNPYSKQTREQLEKSKKSYEDLLKEHEKKLADYKANPGKYDNKDILKNAPNDDIRQKIINGRIKELQDQINKHKGELEKIDEVLNGL
jgi:hypothetical protein